MTIRKAEELKEVEVERLHLHEKLRAKIRARKAKK